MSIAKSPALLLIETLNAELAATAQPQVSGRLLMACYDHDGLMLDLYGTSDKEGGIEVEDASLAGDARSLAALFTGVQLGQMGHALERRAEREYRDGELDRALDRMEERRADRY